MTEEVEIYLANEGSGPAILNTVLGHTFGCIVSNEFGVMLREKGPHKTIGLRHCMHTFFRD